MTVLIFVMRNFVQKASALTWITFQTTGRLECDYTQIVQVFINLLNNAHDALTELSMADKWVRIEVKDEGETFEIRFIDSGLGIPAEISEKILQPFFTTKAVGKGTGLGLSLAQSYVADHKGEFALDESHPNTMLCSEIFKTIPADPS